MQVGDNSDAVLLVDVFQGVHDDLRVQRIKRGDRLVGEDDLRLLDERAGDGDALLLAAGHLAGDVLHAIGETDAREQAAGALQAQGVDQLAPQVAHGRTVDQQHALVVEPDATVAGAEEERLGQVGQGGRLPLLEMGAVAAPKHGPGLAGHFSQ